MSLLDKLWDDTVAGPQPDSGLGKLRKYSTFSLRSNPGKESSDNVNHRSFGDEAAPAGAVADDAMKVTRSIMIVRPPQLDLKDSPPVSPAGSTPPVSPFAGAGAAGKEAYRFRRRSASFAYEKSSGIGPYSPPPPYL